MLVYTPIESPIDPKFRLIAEKKGHLLPIGGKIKQLDEKLNRVSYTA